MELQNIREFTLDFTVHFGEINTDILILIDEDKKEFTADMKNIYNAPNKEVAAAELNNLEQKWGGKYHYAILS